MRRTAERMRMLVVDRCCVAGGVERLCTALLPQLIALGVEVIWAVPSHRIRELNETGVARDGVRLVAIEWPWPSCWRMNSAALRRVPAALKAVDAIHLRRIARLRDELNATHIFYPWILGEPLPARDGARRSIIIYDRNWTRFPQNFREPPSVLDDHVERWLQAADRVIVPSNDVASDLVQRWPQTAAKVTTIPLAAGAVGPERPNPPVDSPLFLYPATFSPHKGHATLLEAAALLWREGRRFRIVLTGHGTERIQSACLPSRSSLFESGASGYAVVEGRGYLRPDAVQDLFARASAVVLPSLYEGFGLPLAEAIASGLPVICSDLPSYREQVERFAVREFVTFVPPGDATTLAAAMASRAAAGPPSRREQQRIAVHARRWTWRDVALSYLEVVGEAA